MSEKYLLDLFVKVRILIIAIRLFKSGKLVTSSLFLFSRSIRMSKLRWLTEMFIFSWIHVKELFVLFGIYWESHSELFSNDCDSNESHTVRILLTPLFFTRLTIFKFLHLFKIALRLWKNENYPRKLLEVVIFVHFGGFAICTGSEEIILTKRDAWKG